MAASEKGWTSGSLTTQEGRAMRKKPSQKPCLVAYGLGQGADRESLAPLNNMGACLSLPLKA